MTTTNLEKRLLEAKDLLDNPTLLDAYPHSSVLVMDPSMDWSHQNLLIAIEQMENHGWQMRGIACEGTLMYALMSRGK